MEETFEAAAAAATTCVYVESQIRHNKNNGSNHMHEQKKQKSQPPPHSRFHTYKPLSIPIVPRRSLVCLIARVIATSHDFASSRDC